MASEAEQFEEATENFLNSEIKFRSTTGSMIYVVVENIERLESKQELQYAFSFRLSSKPAPSGWKPHMGKQEAKIISTRLRIGENRRAETILGYTFTSANTMEQNKSNFKDFVLIQQDENEDDDPLLKDRE